jgi:hypothetical protein
VNFEASAFRTDGSCPLSTPKPLTEIDPLRTLSWRSWAITFPAMKAVTPTFIVSGLLLWGAAFALNYSKGAAAVLFGGAIICFVIYARSQKR